MDPRVTEIRLHLPIMDLRVKEICWLFLGIKVTLCYKEQNNNRNTVTPHYNGFKKNRNTVTPHYYRLESNRSLLVTHVYS